MPTSDYLALIPLIFLILLVIEVIRFFGAGGEKEEKTGSGFKFPGFLKKKEEKKAQKKTKKKRKKTEKEEIKLLGLIHEILEKLKKNLDKKDKENFDKNITEIVNASSVLNKIELEEENEERKVAERLGIKNKRIKELLGEEISLKNSYVALLNQIVFNNPKYSKKIINALQNIVKNWIKINKKQAK